MRGSQKNINYKAQWNPNFAYAIGLLATDGNLSKDGRHINFTSKDIQLVRIFRECLKLTDIKISLKSSGRGKKNYPQIQFSNSRLYQELLKIGLTPNKSKTISRLKIPKRYFFDFLRGCFDGDGTIFSFWDKRWRSSFMFYIAFASASLVFLEWLQKQNKNFCNINGSVKTAASNTYILRYAKRESLILFRKMFYAKKVPCLQRKYAKAQKIFQIDTAHNKITSH